MNRLHIDATNYTPLVSLDIENNHFEISGNSFPENSKKFYTPIIKWMQEYVENPESFTRFIFKLDYISSSSLKSILQILNLLKKIPENGQELEINWYYDAEDEDILDAGNKLAEITDLDFKLIEN